MIGWITIALKTLAVLSLLVMDKLNSCLDFMRVVVVVKLIALMTHQVKA